MKAALMFIVTAIALSCAPAQAQQAASDGGKPVALTEPQDDYADVAPDNHHILFQSNRSGSWQLWLMDRETRQPGRMAPPSLPTSSPFSTSRSTASRGP